VLDGAYISNDHIAFYHFGGCLELGYEHEKEEREKNTCSESRRGKSCA
jgi:hypothetical protein